MNTETKTRTFSAVRQAQERIARSSSLHDVGIDEEGVSEDTSSRELVSSLFRTVISPSTRRAPRNTGSDLKSVRKVTNLIIEAAEDGTLTDDEANAVLNLIIEGFAKRRADKIFTNISELDRTDWFLAASRITKHGR